MPPSCPSKGPAGMFVCPVDGRSGQVRKFREGHPDLEVSLSRRRGLCFDGMTAGNTDVEKAECICSGH